jgi:hypothetical protein
LRSPIRLQQWNCSIRSGDDFKLAVTVYQDNTGALCDVTNSQSRLVLKPERDRAGWNGWGWAGGGSCGYDGWDYGLGYITLDGGMTITAPGYVAIGSAGRLNFALQGSQTQCMRHGRYLLSVQIDLADGEYSQVEGVLQVREGSRLYDQTHVVVPYFQLDATPLDTAPIVPLNYDGVAVDQDGFPEIQQVNGGQTAQLGIGVLGEMVLGEPPALVSGYGRQALLGSFTLGLSALGS